MNNKEIADLILSMTGADPDVVKGYLDVYGLQKFMIEFSTIEGISDSAKEQLENIHLFLLEAENAIG